MRVLAVDDDQSTRSIVSKLLSERGYDVDVVGDGPQALQMIRQQDYDLAILDYAMPMMNGVELFQHIQKLRPKMNGVFLTAHTRIDTVFPAVDAGIARVLSKPVNGRELLTVVEQLIGAPTK